MISKEKRNEVLRMNKIGFKKSVIAKNTGLAASTITSIINTRKRVLVISDPHCGHKSGLTPPNWQRNDQQAETWDWYENRVKELNADILFCMGDMTEGKGRRSGGSELIESTWIGQIDMAQEVIETTRCKTVEMVYGTPCHTGEEEDYELEISKRIGARIHSHAFPKVKGIQFDLKHKIGSSNVPHGRSTALMRSKLWNTLWAERDQQPNSDIILRGHVHYHDFTGNYYFKAMTMPALQGWGSKYGERQCEGIVDTGLVWFDIREGDTLQTLGWGVDIPLLKCHKVKIYSL